MATAEELQLLYTKLVDAARDAKEATAAAHQAKKDLDHAVRAQRNRITDEIIRAVEEQVGTIGKDVRTELYERVDAVIDEIRADWRAKLGLP